LIEHLRTSNDIRRIRVEGHSDNVEIGPSLKSRYPNNMELSKARANGVVRYLVEKGGLDPSRLTAVGYGDTKPTAENTAEEGRTKNRRVELLLHAPETDATASQADVQNRNPKVETSLSRTASTGNTESAAGTDSPDPSTQGTLSTGNASQPSDKDGGGSPNSPDATGPATPDAGKQSTSSQQPASGMTSE
jgi:chemotaxis protein MotB